MPVLPAARCGCLGGVVRRTLYRTAGLAALVCAAALAAQVRQPAVAGAFYPADEKELAAMVDGFLAQVHPPAVEGTILALVSPHAGYPYSGGVAANGYSLLRGKHFDRVVLIAPTHVVGFSWASIYDGDAYATPLGMVEVDKAFARKLADGSVIRLSGEGHAMYNGRGEHAVEVQLPFLQRVLGTFKLVPIVMGDQSYDSCRAVGLAVAKQIKAAGGSTLIVASSDLSHYHRYDDAVAMDRKTLRAVEEWDYLSMSANFDRQLWEACGGGPIITAMIATERAGAVPKLLKYANSGDTTGDRKAVVGYGSMVFFKPLKAAAAAMPEFSLSDAEKSELLALARRSVETAVRQQKLLADVPVKFESFSQERGAFVTLKEKGQLRGCIGYIAPSKPLAETVRDVAAAAAVEDHRFRPVEPSELGAIEYEVSVLSPMRRVLDVNQIQVGKHGLVMRKAHASGLLLPQVPVEEHWDLKTFLEETCRKAGLPAGAWRDADTDIFSFTALVFNERKH